MPQFKSLSKKEKRLQCFDAFGWAAGRASSCKKTEWWDVGVFMCCEVQICTWTRRCHCHSLSLASVNPDWFHLPGFTLLVLAHPGITQVVPDKVQKSSNTIVCV